jgi:hypothetical protein
MRRPDLSDRLLAYLFFAAAVILVAWFAYLPGLAPAWRLPGSPQLYRFGLAGSFLLLVSLFFVLAKRTRWGGSPVRWFSAHIVAALAGGVLVAIHSAGRLRYAPALLLLALAALAALGVWARIQLSRRMSATFAEKHESFGFIRNVSAGEALAGDEDRERLGALIRKKESLLARLEPGAGEGTFSLTPALWLAHPVLAAAYARLVREESAILGVREKVPAAQAHWRRLHLSLAAIFVLGLIGHVVVVTLFAGYVSGGEEIYWWHLAAW